jgi:signal transduction histidine kinase
VLLEVSDQGSGLDRNAFDDVRTSGRVPGLGLAIVRDVAEHHGALVRVTDHGHGTLVRVAFPALTTPHEPS